MEPLRFLGIPISGVGYYMNWVLTNAQIELIASDVSVVDYDYGEKKKRNKGDFDNTKADSKAVKKAADEWKERYGTGENAGKGLSIGDILGNGMNIGVGVKTK